MECIFQYMYRYAKMMTYISYDEPVITLNEYHEPCCSHCFFIVTLCLSVIFGVLIVAYKIHKLSNKNQNHSTYAK